MTTHEVYKYPRYYDIAFGWEPGPEADFLEAAFRRTASGEVRSVLDVACGSGRFALEFARRGLAVAGLDISPEMLDYLGKKAALAELPVEVFVRDMREFQLPRRGFDAAICMTGSFPYLLDIPAITGHLHSVARHLRSRGLYVVDFGTVVDLNQPLGAPERWDMTRDAVRVTCSYAGAPQDYDPVRQTATEVLRMEVWDHGQTHVIEQRATTRLIYPQEFLALVGASGVFELADWYQGFDLGRPFDKPPYHRRMIAVLRKTAEPPPPVPRPRPEGEEPAPPSRGRPRQPGRPQRRDRPARPTGIDGPRPARGAKLVPAASEQQAPAPKLQPAPAPALPAAPAPAPQPAPAPALPAAPAVVSTAPQDAGGGRRRSARRSRAKKAGAGATAPPAPVEKEQQEQPPRPAEVRRRGKRSRAKEPVPATDPVSSLTETVQPAPSPRERGGRRDPGPPSVRLPAQRLEGDPIVEYWARGREDKWQPPRTPRPAKDEPVAGGDPPPAAKPRRRRSRRPKGEKAASPEDSPGGQGG